MKRYMYCMTIFVMSTILFACNSKSLEVKDNQLEPTATSDTTSIGMFNTPQREKDEDQNKQEDDKNNTQQTDDNNISSNNNIDWDKKIIKTADIQLQLDDYKKFNVSLRNSLKQFGAYVASEKQQETDYRLENSISIKVPVSQFDDLVNSLNGDGIKVIEKNISGEDVTGEVVDTKARLQAKLEVREKYLQLLKQAKNMKEILEVQNEINEIQENIEAANGRINYLQHASAYSTINLNYFQYINGSSPNDEKPDFFTKLLRAFSTGTSVISNLILFCISIWPILLMALFAFIYLKRSKLKNQVKA